MPKVLIHYFSGTGNSAHAAGIMKKDLEASGYTVTAHRIESGALKNIQDYDSHIFIFPVYSWAAPAFVKRYARKLRPAKGTKAAVFATFAGDPAFAIKGFSDILRSRGFDVFLSGGGRYPNNWAQTSSPDDPEVTVSEITRGEGMAIIFKDRFIRGETSHFETSGAPGWTKIVGFLFNILGRRFFGKLYIADQCCNNCGICIQSCPVKAIKFAGLFHRKPLWRFNCESCNRCINICPQKAIQTSMPRIDSSFARKYCRHCFQRYFLSKFHPHYS